MADTAKLAAIIANHRMVDMRNITTSKRTWINASILLLVLGTPATYLLWRTQTATAPATVPDAAHPTVASSDPISTAGFTDAQHDGARVAQGTSREPIFADPLPPTDTQVTEVFDELYRRAQRGDSRAACWLGQSLKRCATAKAQMQSAHELIDISAKMNEPADSLVSSIARIEQFGRSLDEGCDGLSQAQLETAFALEMQAAQAMPELRLRAVLAPALEQRHFIRDLERWADYKRVAVPWLEEAAARGDPAALITLARIFGDHRRTARLNPPFRIADDAKFVLYSNLMARYGISFAAAQEDLDAARERLSSDAQAQVLEQIDALYRPDREKLSEEQVQQKLRESLSVRADPSQCDAPPG